MARQSLSIAVLLAVAIAGSGDAHVCTTHTYLGNNPDEGNPGWHEEAQGLAHDADFWVRHAESAVLHQPTVHGAPRAVRGCGAFR